MRTPHCFKDSQRVEKVYTYLSVATKRQVYGQAEEVVYKVLESGEQVLHLLLGHPESQQHPYRHGKGQPLALPVRTKLRVSTTT